MTGSNSIPAPGESTSPQPGRAAVGGLTGSTMNGLGAFLPADAGTYATYRRISSHPTNALVRGIVVAPIVANAWRWSKRDKNVPNAWLDLVRSVLSPMRQRIVSDALKALEFGWAGFEKIWEVRGGRMVLNRLKPLLWDCTDILIDDNGNVRGLQNSVAGGKPVQLTGSKYFIYSHDGEAGNPYGRSRHENIRQAWSEAEQIRQRLAQYMKKVAGIVVQLHYPEGTSRDSTGAERPNQWLGQQVLDAVSAGRSVMFPNGFASSNDLRTSYDLAGKSQWMLSAFEPGGTDHAPGMKLILEYYDALIFRGWMRPERSGLESRHGSKADAQTHSAAGTLDAELIDRDLADAINRQVVDDLLVLNFGEKARGAVTAVPTPIESDSIDVLKQALGDLIHNPSTASTVAQKIDIDAVLAQLDIPAIARAG